MVTTSQNIIGKLKSMGFELDDDIEDEPRKTIVDMTRGAAQVLSDEEVEKLKPIILLKAADMTLNDGRKKITKQDFGFLKRWCFAGILCLRSGILENFDVTSSVLTPFDIEIMKKVKIQNLGELLTTPSSEIANQAIEHLSNVTPSFRANTSEVEFLSERVDLWKMQAELITAGHQPETLSKTKNEIPDVGKVTFSDTNRGLSEIS